MGQPIIRTLGLARSFGSVRAVNGIDLAVPEGSVYGFLGPNGAGKTTTIRLLLGLIRPSGGEVELFGRPLRRRRLELMRRVGALVETPSFYGHLTARENVGITRRLLGGRTEEPDDILKRVGLGSDSARPVRQYSLGMKQRLGLALALLGRPKLLVLDEPTNGLDPAGIQEIRGLIRNMPAVMGVTVFLSSHILSEVERVATHVGIINKGELLLEGTLEELNTRRSAHLELRTSDNRAALRKLGEAGSSVEESDEGILLIGDADEQAAARINAQLVAAGINVYHLRLARPNLEQLFLSLTGADAQEAGQ